jgi:hypothetical protein
MGILNTLIVPPLDPYLYTGPNRITALGPVRIFQVQLDVPYGEYATWLYVGTAGNVNIIGWDGTNKTIPSLSNGWHFIGHQGVSTSGTVATGLLWGS